MRAKIHPKPFGGSPAPAVAKTRHHIAIRPAVLYLGFAGLLATNILAFVGLFLTPDIGRIISGQNETVLSAYEDRISQLRMEVDRLQSRHYAQTGDINLQLQELAQQQEVLVEQHQYVKQLADKAAQLGIDTASVAAPADDPTDDDPTLLTGSIAAPGTASDEVAATAASLNQMLDDSRVALASISDEASGKTKKIMTALAGIGIAPTLPDGDDGVGGPLLPPVDGPEAGLLVDDANDVATALEQFKAARGAADLAPVHMPLVAMSRISSIFGNRKDPFTGRLAFHSGIDFAAPQGTSVLAAGQGTVSFVGQISGYGNVVEITHAGGIITRYGHLSAFLVKKGQVVSTGTPIARVGSTGRSTGPHLHFEVRRADTAVNPRGYLDAGKALQRILAS